MKKENLPQQIFRPSRELKRDFAVKCIKNRFTQDEVLIELMSMWNRGKVRIPQERNYQVVRKS